MSSEKVGGDRVKQETVAVNQIWQRKVSGTHFIIAWIGHATSPIQLSAFTIETRRTNRMNLSTLQSRYTCVDYIRGCGVCHRQPHIRYGKVNDERVYHVACDCLEFDATSPDLLIALRAWRANSKYIEATIRTRSELQVRSFG